MNWKTALIAELRSADYVDLETAQAMQRAGTKLRAKVYERCRSRARYADRKAADHKRGEVHHG